MKLPSFGDIGLRLLALLLAIVIYHLVKNGTGRPTSDPIHDRDTFHH